MPIFDNKFRNPTVPYIQPTVEPDKTGMMKARLAYASAFGNPTANRMVNNDTRSYTFTKEDEMKGGAEVGTKGNVFVSSGDEYVYPQIQDVEGQLKFIDKPWSESNINRTLYQSIRFDNPDDARYFGENYKKIAPMMKLYK